MIISFPQASLLSSSTGPAKVMLSHFQEGSSRWGLLIVFSDAGGSGAPKVGPVWGGEGGHNSRNIYPSPVLRTQRKVRQTGC